MNMIIISHDETFIEDKLAEDNNHLVTLLKKYVAKAVYWSISVDNAELNDVSKLLADAVNADAKIKLLTQVLTLTQAKISTDFSISIGHYTIEVGEYNE